MIIGRYVLFGAVVMACVADSPTLFRLPAPAAFVSEPPASRLSRQAAVAETTITAHPVEAPNETWVFTDRVALRLEPGTPLESILEGRPLTLARTIAPDLYVLQASDASAAWAEAEALAETPRVNAAYPVCHPPRAVGDSYAAAPTDEFFQTKVEIGSCEIAPGVIIPGQIVSGQWYLENRDPVTGAQQGVDLNVRPAWSTTRGEGITVAVADTGVDLGHTDLKAAAEGSPHFNFSTGLPNGSATQSGAVGAHGTSVAGILAATANNAFGISGIAPGSRLASWVIFDARGRPINGERLGDLFRFASNQVAVQNHSWVPVSLGQRGPDALEDAGLDSAWMEGRDGLGTVMVFAAGNGRLLGKYANDNGYASDPRTIGVTGVTSQGRATATAEPGSSILVAAPAGDDESGGLFTTDLSPSSGLEGANFLSFCPPYEFLSDFRWGAIGFKDTSSAAPQVSGVAALMLSANPRLTARDVQQVLLLSARHTDLQDPDLHTNAAGLMVSHNVGFGIINAAEAVRLARAWSNRPPVARLTRTHSEVVPIPDGGYRVEVVGDGVPPELAAIPGISGFGIQPDRPMAFQPLTHIGRATNAPQERLDGRGALIERGDILYDSKLATAAEAGARFGIVYNLEQAAAGSCPGGDQLCVPVATDFSPIPVIFIGRTAGLALQDLIRTNPAARVRIALNGPKLKFNIAETWQCERVGVRLKTDFTVRGDLRITLTSPSGTTSILQRYNGDTGSGPADWTYWSTHHYYEPSAGDWTLAVTDEAPGEGTGRILEATLIVNGVPIVDSDHDGLEDTWELTHLAGLALGATEDPDEDGYNNLRESLEGGNPLSVNQRNNADVAFFNSSHARLSWPSREGERFQVRYGSHLGDWSEVIEVSGTFPVTAVVVPASSTEGFFQIDTLRGTP
ncbi:MAG TPA: S8 family serine peptidase [Verrucomicrobiota bacterium]|nr:S8 family serine peptidase [Verrucomicrobiota bacterium]